MIWWEGDGGTLAFNMTKSVKALCFGDGNQTWKVVPMYPRGVGQLFFMIVLTNGFRIRISLFDLRFLLVLFYFI